MRTCHLLDFRRMNLAAAADDDFLLAPDDAQPSARVDHAQVSAHEPSRAVERLLGRTLIAEVAEHEAGAAPADLAHLADRHLAVGIFRIEDAHLVSCAGAAAGSGD